MHLQYMSEVGMQTKIIIERQLWGHLNTFNDPGLRNQTLSFKYPQAYVRHWSKAIASSITLNQQ